MIKNFVSYSRIESCARDFANASGGEEAIIKSAVVRKLPNGKWTVMSLKGKQLGEYDTKSEAVKRLRQIEYFKAHKKNKKASKKEEISYSSFMRDLKKNNDKDTAEKFQKEFKKLFDEAVISGSECPEGVLEEAIKCVSFEKDLKLVKKLASAIDLGDPAFAGKYLADLIKFLLRRISPNRRQKSIENLRKKIYYLNEYNIASKHVPASSSIGQSITLLKTILLEHQPQYIRSVLNSVVRSL